jgi:uncharacterized membrane protein YphA (DoxX/SURF4 family)
MVIPQSVRPRVGRDSEGGMTATNETTRSAGDSSRSPRPSAGRWAVAIRWAAGIVFVVFGAGKFVNHASELASFRQYSLPVPGAFVDVIGLLEIGGALLLVAGIFVRPAAIALAADMVGAIIVSGLGRGERVSLTLAPLLLVAMIFLIRFGSDSRSLGRRVTSKPSAAHRRRGRRRSRRAPGRGRGDRSRRCLAGRALLKAADRPRRDLRGGRDPNRAVRLRRSNATSVCRWCWQSRAPARTALSGRSTWTVAPGRWPGSDPMPDT